jgi:hypothetical protein
MLARRHCRRSRQEIKCCFGTAAIVSLRKLAAVHPNYRTKARTKDDAVAEQFFQQAIDLDPMFVGGYIGLSAVLSRAKGTQAREEELARRAVALDSGNAEAHARLALHSTRAEIIRAHGLKPSGRWHSVRIWPRDRERLALFWPIRRDRKRGLLRGYPDTVAGFA